jgi:hypothetical protein
MAQTTRFNGTYSIVGADATSNVQVTSHTLIVTGNLKVLGTVANVASTNTQITDNIITLNQGETGYGVTAVYAGIEVDRGQFAKTAMRWNESLTRWELTVDGSVYTPIVTGQKGIEGVYQDAAPQLGGNLDTLARSIFSSNNQIVKFDTNLAIKNTTVAPSTLSGYNTVYTQTPDSGGSGLYVTNTTRQQQELITKSKAVFFSLMF